MDLLESIAPERIDTSLLEGVSPGIEGLHHVAYSELIEIEQLLLENRQRETLRVSAIRTPPCVFVTIDTQYAKLVFPALWARPERRRYEIAGIDRDLSHGVLIRHYAATFSGWAQRGSSGGGSRQFW